MSYILEALKKSEQKKQRGTVPSLETVHDPIPEKAKKKSVWPYLLVVTLFVNMILLSLLLKYRQQNKSPTLQLSIGNQSESEHIKSRDLHSRLQSQASSTSIKHPDNAHPETSGSGDEKTAQMQTNKAGSDMNNPDGGPSYRADKMDSDTLTPLTAQITPSKEKTIRGIDAVEDEESTTVNANEMPIVSQAQPDQAAEPDHSPAEPYPDGEINAVSKQSIPRIESLPISVRQHLPEISISFHAYSHKPASRLVSVNGRIMREGQFVTNDLQLEEITKEGIILNYDGRRFQVKMF